MIEDDEVKIVSAVRKDTEKYHLMNEKGEKNDTVYCKRKLKTGSKFKVQGSNTKVQGSNIKVQGSKFKVFHSV